MNLDLVVNILFCVLIIISSPLVVMLIKKAINKVEDARLREIVLTFVEAADQMLKKIDPTGEQRKDYVLRSLQEMGIECDTYINALIEQAVLGLWYYEPKQDDKVLEHVDNIPQIVNPFFEGTPKKDWAEYTKITCDSKTNIE